ncbi:conserved hypothetical protein [Theileria equi strain WA]|uniref:Signal peptide containing protein n=1 Tax=Theileria equi strain WA TaxID=1537102 RepID=L1LFW4_THEEQ|nr:conserved hypothetical protein [Theileria equi strain WA]EKX74053.1 conserved hypothetical protein [Theileria equi strain WA]|eukprot:XP_004833505.1 conserved hypothetical protein [Theileria equi strain WA]
MYKIIYFGVLVVSFVSLVAPTGKVGKARAYNKGEILRDLQDAVTEIIQSGSGVTQEILSIKKRFKLVEALSFCLESGDITKQELASCLNTLIIGNGLDPPVSVSECLGEYIMCTSRVCLGAINEEKDDAIKCLVECLPQSILCITRSTPLPERIKGL